MKSAFVLVAAVAAVVASAPGTASAQAAGGQLSPKQKAAEHKAISAFAAGNYQDAVNIYSELYADYREPIYLRNIGRCYQKMKDPTRALASFEEYLNKAKNLSDDEKKEIVGYMNEMRALQEKPSPAPVPPPAPPAPRPNEPTTAQPAPAPPATPQPGPPVAPPVTSVPSVPLGPAAYPPVFPVAPPIAGPTGGTVQTAPPPPAPDNSGVRWVGTGALILSGVALVASGALLWSSWSTYNDNKDGKCLTTADKCSSSADRIDSLNLWSGITLGLAVVSAATGGTLLYLYPAPSASGLQAGVAWTY